MQKKVFVTDWHEKGLSEFTYMYIMTVEFFLFYETRFRQNSFKKSHKRLSISLDRILGVKQVLDL